MSLFNTKEALIAGIIVAAAFRKHLEKNRSVEFSLDLESYLSGQCKQDLSEFLDQVSKVWTEQKRIGNQPIEVSFHDQASMNLLKSLLRDFKISNESPQETTKELKRFSEKYLGELEQMPHNPKVEILRIKFNDFVKSHNNSLRFRNWCDDHDLRTHQVAHLLGIKRESAKNMFSFRSNVTPDTLSKLTKMTEQQIAFAKTIQHQK